MPAQTDFFPSLYKHRSKRARKGPMLAARMIAILSKHGGWLTRREFAERYGFSKDGRECRLGREASHHRIISSQQHGFKLLRHATPEEIAESVGFWRTQKEAAEREIAGLMRRAHDAVNRGRRAVA